jgi:diguanylate cyclase (GGDEF)-like protein
MLMIDADYFKKINDVFGHAAGDAVLVAIAQQIQGVLRQEDVLARYGGEEFVVMLPDTCLRDALDVAERIRLEVANLVHPSLDAQHTVTVSIGVSERLVTQKHSEQLLECADRALFLAKQTGRNRICGSQAGVVSVSGTEPALSQLARS